MTFQEALEATKSLTLYEDRHATHTEFVVAAMAEQIEANRLAIEELRKEVDSLRRLFDRQIELNQLILERGK